MFVRVAFAGSAVVVTHFQEAVADEVDVAVARFVKAQQGFVFVQAVFAAYGFRFGVFLFEEQRGQFIAAVIVDDEGGINTRAACARQDAFVSAAVCHLACSRGGSRGGFCGSSGRRGSRRGAGSSRFGGLCRFFVFAAGESDAGDGQGKGEFLHDFSSCVVGGGYCIGFFPVCGCVM